MSYSRVEICTHIIRECFGEVVQKVMTFLLRNGSSTLRFMLSKVDLKPDQVSLYCTALQRISMIFRCKIAIFIKLFCIKYEFTVS